MICCANKQFQSPFGLGPQLRRGPLNTGVEGLFLSQQQTVTWLSYEVRFGRQPVVGHFHLVVCFWHEEQYIEKLDPTAFSPISRRI